MVYLKSCPKCRGDMYLEKDNYGAYRQCLQCGLVRDFGELAVALTPAVAFAPARRGRPRKVAIVA